MMKDLDDDDYYTAFKEHLKRLVDDGKITTGSECKQLVRTLAGEGNVDRVERFAILGTSVHPFPGLISTTKASCFSR
jgi:hypothetical protein